ncbi:MULTISPECIES: hypothetical protein [unclassified Nostoc]|nr:hypothetical protein [Nostoc sp. 'Peltigera membranacea cyanobiont' 232]
MLKLSLAASVRVTLETLKLMLIFWKFWEKVVRSLLQQMQVMVVT